MNTEPMITVIIPTFNRVSLLPRAVRSALDSGDNTVVRIFDNASTDGTAQWCRTTAASNPRVQYVQRPLNIGGSRNFHEAFLDVETDYVRVLADDDCLAHGSTMTLHEILSRSVAGMSFGTTISCTEHGRAFDFDLQSELTDPNPAASLELFSATRPPIWSGCLFRTSAVAAIDSTSLSVPVVDVDFIWRMSLSFGAVGTTAVTAFHTRHSGNASTLLPRSALVDEQRGAARALLDSPLVTHELAAKFSDYVETWATDFLSEKTLRSSAKADRFPQVIREFVWRRRLAKAMGTRRLREIDRQLAELYR